MKGQVVVKKASALTVPCAERELAGFHTCAQLYDAVISDGEVLRGEVALPFIAVPLSNMRPIARRSHVVEATA